VGKKGRWGCSAIGGQRIQGGFPSPKGKSPFAGVALKKEGGNLFRVTREERDVVLYKSKRRRRRKFLPQRGVLKSKRQALKPAKKTLELFVKRGGVSILRKEKRGKGPSCATAPNEGGKKKREMFMPIIWNTRCLSLWEKSSRSSGAGKNHRTQVV